MAIDPRISLGVQQASVTPAINIFNQAMQRNRQNAIQDQLLPGQLDLQQQQVQTGKINLQSAQDKQDLQSIANFATLQEDAINQAQQGNTLPLMTALSERGKNLLNEGRDASQTFEALDMLQQGNAVGAVRGLTSARGLAQQQGLLGQQRTAGQREQQDLLNTIQSGIDESGNLKPINELNATERAAAIKLGLAPRATGSAAQTIAQQGTVEDVASVESVLSGAREGGKLDVQTRKLPNIKSLVKKAELRASKENEVFTALNRAKAALPGITEVVGKLKELAPMVTSTFSGKVFDTAAKELGFGSTKGATSRAKFVSMVDNQVLPLLRDTFGAAFTAAEGDRLRDALADPDAAPDAKIAQLDAFIEQKFRDIETQELEASGLSGEQVPTSGFKILSIE